jgi:hypothetical protein
MIFSKEDAKRIWEEVKLNNRELEACTGHRFAGGMPKLGERHACLVCGGLVDNSQLFWYIQGAKHAGTDPNAIWPGWTARRHLDG